MEKENNLITYVNYIRSRLTNCKFFWAWPEIKNGTLVIIPVDLIYSKPLNARNSLDRTGRVHYTSPTQIVLLKYILSIVKLTNIDEL